MKPLERMSALVLPVYTAFVIAIVLTMAHAAHAQTDPGPRPSTFGNATRLPNLTDDQAKFWGGGQNVFKQTFSVSGAISGEPGIGLGPSYNGNSCVMCHSQPTVGGSSPLANPQIGVATVDGAANILPSFIMANGPVREARFILDNDGNPDGGVHDLFTIAGRSDAPGCALAQPDFTKELSNGNVIFRIPTPLFGLGFVENTPDKTLIANLQANPNIKSKLGIAGRFNTSGNDSTITRFGWKAQNKSLAMFAGEALNVELGVSNEIFSNERRATAACVFNTTPEDITPASGPITTTSPSSGTATQMASAMENLAFFMALNAAPVPAVPPNAIVPPGEASAAASVANGQTLFTKVGCVHCHSASLVTAASQFPDLNNATFAPYSDFALHHMGSTLADGVSQGQAGPDEFRTAPLWGAGQRLFFLHDGRTSDLLQAVEAHHSPGRDCTVLNSSQQFEANGESFSPDTQSNTCGSEANAVISNFNGLNAAGQQDILNFLRSL
ncbi:MAG TPA: di-heme oxidoredictase family protein [Candidatus Binataceae bacterium]|nr:di-heme oxidoredictase family protein [Candidatus Binataceae bacterium]